jgi:hypothetical protein
MKTNKQSGQSTIEFIFCFIFAVSFILLVFNSALNYTTGYVVHYATFMASRVYMTQDSNETWSTSDRKGVRAAKEAFAKYKLSIFGITDDKMVVVDKINVSAGEYLMTGVYTQFERKIDIVGKITGQTKLELISESYLGREPTRGICASRICYAITGLDRCDSSMDITLFDNGC